MPGFSNYLANDIINTRLRGTATPYVTVSTAEVLDDATGGGTITGVQSIVLGVPVAGVSSNTGAVSFPAAAAGVYAYVQIWDSAAKTNLLYSGSLTTNKTSDGTDTLVFNAGQLTVTNT